MLSGVRASASVLALLVACGPRGGAPLAPAGANEDDGVGGLARSSTKLIFDGAGDDEPTYQDDERYRRAYDYDPLAHYGYGNFGYGGFGYGSVGYGSVGYGYALGGRVEVPVYEARGGNSGAIEGVVGWKGDGGVAWPVGCPLARTARAGAPVAGAVVYVDKLGYGRSLDGRTGGVVTATGCGLEPAVQVVGPLPASVIIDNASPAAARLTVTTIVREHAELDPGGRLDVPVRRAGVMMIDVAGGAPAWVIGEAHPYYAITDDHGRFALDTVPAGAHTLVVWTPPLVTAIGPDGPRWSAPTIERRTIVVPTDGVATVQLSITPAP